MISKIDELLNLTEKMLSLALDGAWDEVARYEPQRVTTISSMILFKGDAADDVVAKFKQAMEINAEILALAKTEKDKIAEELNLSRKQEKANQAYRDIVDN